MKFSTPVEIIPSEEALESFSFAALKVITGEEEATPFR
ncbi:butyrate kinase [Alkaliphilus hydrothermalis]|uniref:Butyrate kinase n=1 Tax=Alkaliphilus hydrothermalis TaxID=1482730 RepID=A0ABS2NTM9_9FIRM|nr:butyrate kinase [Alkaliphilus hydrothermalis]